MNPVTHFLTGWLLANAAGLDRRDRALATIAAVIPDVDGLGVLTGIVSRDNGLDLDLYSRYHHVLAHNVVFGLLLVLAGYALASRKRLTAILVLFGFHVHLLEDILSGRGPDGAIWAVSYLFPVFGDIRFSWAGQWELNAWPNFAITIAALAITFYLAWYRGFSPLNIFSLKADRAFIAALRNRFPNRL